MKIYIAGAGLEHGRSCFLVEMNQQTILFDCGIRIGFQDKYPLLSKTQVNKIDYVFISHIHEDHCGALQWLYEEMGCTATFVTSSYTLSKLKFIPNTTIITDESQIESIKVKSGYSGHCEGAKWYLVESKNESVLFTGDYEENTSCFKHDYIRNIKCNVAICDCAYNNDLKTYEDNLSSIKLNITKALKLDIPIILPVPPIGRATELCNLCYSWFKNTPIFSYNVDNLEHCKDITNNEIGKKGITFLGDSQLNNFKDNKIIDNSFVLFTGTIKRNTNAEYLLNLNRVHHLRFNIHMNLNDVISLKEKNNFKYTILTHSKTDISKLSNKTILAPSTGEYITI